MTTNRRLPRALVFAALALAAGRGAAHDQVPGRAQTRPVLLRGGDLYTVSHGVLKATDLLFDAGRIVAIGPNLELPVGVEVVDVSGRRVYPGLIAASTNLGLTEIGAVRSSNDLAERGDVTPEVAAHVAFNPDSELIPTIRAHGITTAQVVPSGSLLRGRPYLARLDGWTKEDSAARLVDGLALAWPGPGSAFDFERMRRRTPEERDKERAERLDRLRRAFDDAKGYLGRKGTDPEPAVDQRWEAMRDALEGKARVYVEADGYREIREALEWASEYGLQIVITGGADAPDLADALRDRGVPVIVGGAQGLPRREDDPYDAAFTVPARLHAAGVKFCIARPGSWDVRNLPLDAAQAVAFGLPADEALRAVTLSAAEILGLDDEQGSLDVGKEATLFVSEGDVLDSLGRRVVRMWIAGREVTLDDRHKELFRKYRQR